MPVFDLDGYPWTRQFFEKDLRRIPTLKPKVYEEFAAHTQLSGEDLKRAFRPDYIPRVRLKPMGLYGYTPPVRDEIWLSKVFVHELEAALPRNKVPRNLKHYSPSQLETKALLLLEVTVVHELVHFTRRKTLDSARINMMRNPGIEEAIAQAFEQDAYGKFFTVENLLLSKYMPVTAATIKK